MTATSLLLGVGAYAVLMWGFCRLVYGGTHVESPRVGRDRKARS